MSRLKFIKQNYQTMTDEEMAIAEGVSPALIKAIREQHGLHKRESSGRSWSAKDEAALKKLYPEAPWEKIYERFPERTHGAITNKALVLGIKREVNYRTKIYQQNHAKKKKLRNKLPNF